MADAGPIRFYFSLRSPYAWLAVERLEEELGDLGVPITLFPIYPIPGFFPNDPAAVPAKVAHLVQDVRRLTRERGLTVRFPSAVDPDWNLPHAACLAADRAGAGKGFALAIFRQRWVEGLDVGDAEVVEAAAQSVGLRGSAIVEAARSEPLRTEAAEGWNRAAERDNVFGVPSFVYADKLYWGQDRMRFVRSAVLRKSDPASAR